MDFSDGFCRAPNLSHRKLLVPESRRKNPATARLGEGLFTLCSEALRYNKHTEIQ